MGKEVLFALFCFDLPLSSGVSDLSEFGGQETLTKVAEVSSFKKPERDVPGLQASCLKGPWVFPTAEPWWAFPAG